MIGINLVGKDTLNSPHFKTIDDAKNQRYLWVRGNVANLLEDPFLSLIFLRLSVRGISSQNPSICLLLLTVDAQQTKSKQKVGKIKKNYEWRYKTICRHSNQEYSATVTW
jgi:hypothetical protein